MFIATSRAAAASASPAPAGEAFAAAACGAEAAEAPPFSWARRSSVLTPPSAAGVASALAAGSGSGSAFGSGSAAGAGSACGSGSAAGSGSRSGSPAGLRLDPWNHLGGPLANLAGEALAERADLAAQILGLLDQPLNRALGTLDLLLGLAAGA